MFFLYGTHFLTIASDYRSWVLYFSLPVLYGILPEPYFTHYALLVAAMHILLGEDTSESSLERAGIYLGQFYQNFSSLYGQYTTGNNLMLQLVQ